MLKCIWGTTDRDGSLQRFNWRGLDMNIKTYINNEVNNRVMINTFAEILI